VTAFGSLLLTACDASFFFEPTDASSITVAVRFGLSESELSGSTGPGDAFDKADNAHVRLEAQGQTIHEEDAALKTVGQDRHLKLTLDLGQRPISATLLVDLMRGADVLFTGESAVTLTPGEAASVDLALSVVISQLILADPPTSTRVGVSVQLTAEGIFATGDLTSPVAASWLALNTNVEVTQDGVLMGLAPGPGRVRATFGGHSAEATIEVIATCAESLTITSQGDLDAAAEVTCVEGDVRIQDPAAQVELTLLESVGGSVIVEDNSILISIRLPVLSALGGGVFVNRNQTLSSIDLPALTSVGSRIDVFDNPRLSDATLSGGTNVPGGIRVQSNGSLAGTTGQFGGHIP